ncbi:MAG: hypothetical protein V4773_21305 [Verrucomicrobiota bacterium]
MSYIEGAIGLGDEEMLKQRLADLSDDIVRAETRATELRFLPPSASRDELIAMNERTLTMLHSSRGELHLVLADQLD